IRYVYGYISGFVRFDLVTHQVLYRGGGSEQLGVEGAALDRLPGGLGRGRGANGPVGRDVVDLPALVDKARGKDLGGDVGPGQQDPFDGVDLGVVGRPGSGQSSTGRSVLGRGEGGLGPEATPGLTGGLPDHRDLDPGEGAGVQTVGLQPFTDGFDGVDRGEGHPLVAAGDQATDGPFHLLRGARRLHGDGGYLLG